MKQKHRITINVANRSGDRKEVLQSANVRVPKRLLKFLFGDFCRVIVLTPGETVDAIEIKEVNDSMQDDYSKIPPPAKSLRERRTGR